MLPTLRTHAPEAEVLRRLLEALPREVALGRLGGPNLAGVMVVLEMVVESLERGERKGRASEIAWLKGLWERS